jgi:hypothetical protein
MSDVPRDPLTWGPRPAARFVVEAGSGQTSCGQVASPYLGNIIPRGLELPFPATATRGCSCVQNSWYLRIRHRYGIMLRTIEGCVEQRVSRLGERQSRFACLADHKAMNS